MSPLVMDSAIPSSLANNEMDIHPLNDKWVLYAHLPHDTTWNIDSYKRVFGFNALEDALALSTSLSESIIKNCMLFLMRGDIKPLWEDPKNIQGGSFSFKVNNKNVITAWQHLFYAAVGECLTKNPELASKITGITISPKRSFCIIKIWVSDCSIQDISMISKLPGLYQEGCMFKKHNMAAN